MFLSPPVTSSEWNNWYLAERNNRIAYCENMSRTKYYISPNGDDALGDGSQSNPWHSFSSAQQVIQQSNGFVEILFERGGTYGTLTGIDTAIKPFIKIGDYGDINLPKPIITTFRPIAPESWSPYQGYFYQSFPETVTWVRSSNGPLVRGNSSNFVSSTFNSWYYNSATQTLYVNSPYLSSLEYTVPTEAGIILRGDGNLLEDIVVEGFGMKTTSPSQQHPIEIRTTANRQAVVIGCEGYYSSSHVIVHLGVDNEFGPNAYGGIATFVDCKAGWANFNGSGGESIFNTYSLYGGQDVIFDNVIVSNTTLPSQDWPYSVSYRGLGIYGHTGGPNWPVGRIIVNEAFVENAMAGVGFSDAPPTQNIADAKISIVGSHFECEANAISNPYIAISKCYFDLFPQPNTYSLANYAQDGWLLNSIVSINLSRHPWHFALFNNPPNTSTSPEFYHNMFIIKTPHPTSIFNIDYDGPTQAFAGKFENNVIVHWNPSNVQWQMGGMNNNYIVHNDNAYEITNPNCGSILQCLAESSVINTSLNANSLFNRKTIGPIELYQCADVNLDYTVDFFDYLDFVVYFSTGASLADFNSDTTVDFFDYLDFVESYTESC